MRCTYGYGSADQSRATVDSTTRCRFGDDGQLAGQVRGPAERAVAGQRRAGPRHRRRRRTRRSRRRSRSASSTRDPRHGGGADHCGRTTCPTTASRARPGRETPLAPTTVHGDAAGRLRATTTAAPATTTTRSSRTATPAASSTTSTATSRCETRRATTRRIATRSSRRFRTSAASFPRRDR